MTSNYKEYAVQDSSDRIDSILDSSDNAYEELDSIPSRDKLTFNNGFYVNCSAIFIDLRGSSELPKKYKRPRLARIYRSYLSECVAVINGNSKCSEININGDCAWGIIDTPYQLDINGAFATAFRLNSLVKILNCRYKRYSIDPIAAGIGLSYGRALMIKAGYKGSTINDLVWMGDVVNDASNLCNKANRKWQTKPILVSNLIYENLNEHNKALLNRNLAVDCYEGDVVDGEMEKWWNENCANV